MLAPGGRRRRASRRPGSGSRRAGAADRGRRFLGQCPGARGQRPRGGRKRLHRGSTGPRPSARGARRSPRLPDYGILPSLWAADGLGDAVRPSGKQSFIIKGGRTCVLPPRENPRNNLPNTPRNTPRTIPRNIQRSPPRSTPRNTPRNITSNTEIVARIRPRRFIFSTCSNFRKFRKLLSEVRPSWRWNFENYFYMFLSFCYLCKVTFFLNAQLLNVDASNSQKLDPSGNQPLKATFPTFSSFS